MQMRFIYSRAQILNLSNSESLSLCWRAQQAESGRNAAKGYSPNGQAQMSIIYIV